ncbi:hypothetical protein [Ichthyenterobacterium magnum]|uniref:Capsular polysaccharide biosynthesis protein n=1 Tax=Ichthyenterobacterium magnum TaxID=1230530 RepID=A0A420DX76_9FLAO|nr:hypothetical protein [Ichthyenterobacterium magnum]RKE98834.1 hypothetical protein BXY80_0929 [Ichthyenterobacterium magnum]
MKNICFVTNYKKTYFFDAIGKEIIARGGKVYWIVLNKMLYDYLLPTYGEDNLLLINKERGSIPNMNIGEYKLNELASVDRALKYYGEWSYDFLRNIQKPIYNFISNNKVSYVFGETTYAHEVMMCRMFKDKKELSCTYLHPQTIRIPGYHFTFLEDEFQSEIYKGVKFDTYKEGYVIKVQRPTESVVNEKRVKKSMNILSKLKRSTRFFTQKNMENDDPSISPTNLSGRLNKGLTEEWNRLTYPFVKTAPYSEVENKKFVVYTLHKQPEASVDVVGRYYDNQYTNIQNIWRILPDDWHLVVKEHTNAIGDRSLSFFKKIKKLRNLVLLNEHVNSHKIIQDAKAIFSVSGSIAYEAALYGKPAFLFVPIFFDKLQNCQTISLETLRNTNNIEDLLANWKEDRKHKMTVETFSKYLLTYSAKGLISDPLTDPKCMEEENLNLVINAFLKLVE